MEFYRFNSTKSLHHISMDMNKAVCGTSSPYMEAKEILKSWSVYRISSLTFPTITDKIEEWITCPKCLKWYYNPYNFKDLDNKIL